MAAGHGNPVKAIYFAFFANFGVAITKTIAAFYSGSSSMMAESIHSYADTGNQLLLLLGLKRSKRPADKEHPLGYGKATYFWSFMVAIMLFSVGGLFSIYEGWHKLHDPQPLEYIWLAQLVLVISMLLEGLALYKCTVEINKSRGDRSLWEWLHQSRSSELIVVFGEDVAALLGLTIALVCVTIASITGNPFFDALGSICIGVLLVVVAVFVSIRVKELLIGRSADPDVVAAIQRMIAEDEDIREVFNVITLQMGAKVMLAAKIRLNENLPTGIACEKINQLEVALKEEFPEIGWCFVEPDVRD